MIRSIAILLIIPLSAVCQRKEHTGRLFLHWGYNRSAYTQSDVHIEGPGYDFTINDLAAKDRPTAFSPDLYLDLKSFTIPQYVYRLGYFFNDRWSISGGLDHMKYVMRPNQTLVVDGTIEASASKSYAGTYNQETIAVGNNFLWLEHTDGLNYLSIEVDYNRPLVFFGKDNWRLDASIGLGLGLYIPKSRVIIFGDEVDNKFHLAGWGASGQGQFKLYFKEAVFFTTGIKAGCAMLTNVLVDGTQQTQASHNFGWMECFGALGLQIHLLRN